MRTMPIFISLMALMIISSSALALDIDEKLTLRFLKVSATKKTVLINRGSEDGLVIGDHAKFFITSGVVARGIVEKVSPGRSIWSLYRVVDPTEIVDDKVLNLKIASPVKITEDPTKSLKDEPIPGGVESLSLEEGKELVVTDGDQEELNDLGLDSMKRAPVNNRKMNTTVSSKSKSSNDEISYENVSTSKKWEVWGMLYLNSLSGTVESETDTASTSSTASAIDFSLGFERYFFDSDSFFKDVSLMGFLHKRSLESGQEIKSTADWTEFGAGANYHFYNPTAALNKVVGYVTFTVGTGSSSSSSKVVSGSVTTESPDEEGKNTFLSFGLGAKYIISNGFGIRGILDYYNSTESYEFADGSTSERSLSGPRIQFGLSYRF